ncbi:murein DD-endopeptidase MepM/ murein hydrolase activator NlpD [Dichotomicrobium thermohalophilum]|uniref:Murein DD-endopeptidase MepM/ murein hydrolase activator NlpD n=1 Tax=Dichotomicrobium thermohalophilum TaxID=933063 RepID=A0A397QBP6_9HYPH|nr:murein DD-endopeptidase MepM/ murein hydrolase activator NlpD [Dichotomicrobium thermohalophilum]
MSRFGVSSGPRVAVCEPGFRSKDARIRPFRPAKRLTCAAIIALAVAGCSQEVQRFDYETRESRTAQLHYNEERYAEEGFASWRGADRSDLRSRRAQWNGDPVTRSLPDDREPLREYERRRRAEPAYARDPRPPRRTTHTVRDGDTLYSIARSYDVGVDELAEVNGLTDPGLIRVGDTLYIPDENYELREREPDRRRTARRAPRRPETREAPRERRYAVRRERRYDDEALYADPLLLGLESREDRRRYRADRGNEERRSRDRRRAARVERQPAPRRERISSARPQRAARVTPPPAPEQRPERRQPSRVARSNDQQPERVARAEPTTERQVASEQKTSAAECSALMKNPPARSGANFRRPANGLIISRFGEQSNGERNDGINISVPRGTPVKAAENGVVVYAGDELTGLGKLVLVRHADGWVSAYAHNDQIMVKRCDTVERGQMIARAGVTGAVTKPQLHFELRKNARPVDPEQHLAGTS